jgi:transposase-like protein
MLHPCSVSLLGKQRNGAPRLWCVIHRARATAFDRCTTANPIRAQLKKRTVNISDYPGGVALWGALPPVVNTAGVEGESGVHLHARPVAGEAKEIDETYDEVVVIDENERVTITADSATAYNVSRLFGQAVKYLACPHCHEGHVDAGEFAVKAHRKHLCLACGRDFYDSTASIGNPIALLAERYGKERSVVIPNRPLTITHADCAGGFQLWGTHPAIIWTGPKPEESGVHLHGFKDGEDVPWIDETYSSVELEGHVLDPVQVRLLMAQLAVPAIAKRLVPARCPRCDQTQFDEGINGAVPRRERRCTQCGTEFVATGRRKIVISNPMLEIVMKINESFAMRRKSRPKSRVENHRPHASVRKRQTHRPL